MASDFLKNEWTWWNVIWSMKLKPHHGYYEFLFQHSKIFFEIDIDAGLFMNIKVKTIFFS